MSDPYTMVNFRPTTLTPELERRGMTAGRVSKRDLARYYWLVNSVSLSLPSLSSAERAALVEFVSTREWLPQEIADMGNHLRQWLRSPRGQRYDVPRLMGVIADTILVERIALIDDCEIRYLGESTADATSVA